MSWFRGGIFQNPTLNGSGPGFTRYTKNEFDMLDRQHNILAMVGNGFDLQVLQDYGPRVDSRYESFYHYLKMSGFDQKNSLLHHMDAERQLHLECGGHQDWSDIEAAVAKSVNQGRCSFNDLLEDLRAVQAAFAQFLQMVAPSQLLDDVGVQAAEHKLSHKSLAEFLADVIDRDDYLSMDFPREVDHYHLFNFQFVNFNYTTLLDDYVHLDPKQFDPLRHKTVDTNFSFRNDPNSYLGSRGKMDVGYSSYVLTDVVHPHGVLSTPRSLLLGIDAEDDYKKRRGAGHRLKKAYWSQAHALYRNHFAQADLFIVFGCSLGDSDGWWWRNIVRGLKQPRQQTRPAMKAGDDAEVIIERSELIIYWWNGSGGHTVASVKDHFFKVAGVPAKDLDRQALADRIHVVLYDDATPRTFLRTRARPEAP